MIEQLSAKLERASSDMSFIKTVGFKDSTPVYTKTFGKIRKREAYVFKASDSTIRDEIIDTLSAIDSVIAAEPLRITSNLDMKSYSEEIGEDLPIKTDDIAVKNLAELRDKKAADFLWKRPDCNPLKKEDNSGLLAKFAVMDIIYDGKITEAYRMLGKSSANGNEIYNNTLSFDFDLHGKLDLVRGLSKGIYLEMEKRDYTYIKKKKLYIH